MPMRLEPGRVLSPDMFGRMEASRAVNEGTGLDPVSLGLISAPAPAVSPAAMPIISAEEMGLQLAPPPPLAPAPAYGPISQPVPGAAPAGIHVNLTEGAAILNGRELRLAIDAQTAILEILLEAYEQSLRQEMDDLRAEFGLLPEDVQRAMRAETIREAMRQADLAAPMVRPVPGEAAPDQPEEQGQPPAEDVQSLPKRARRKRGLPVVSGSKAGEGVTTPQP